MPMINVVLETKFKISGCTIYGVDGTKWKRDNDFKLLALIGVNNYPGNREFRLCPDDVDSWVEDCTDIGDFPYNEWFILKLIKTRTKIKSTS